MLTVTPIHAYSDNFIWLIKRDDSSQVVLVDPGQAAPVIKYLEENALELVAILITHQHYDHTGGVEELLKKYANVRLYGPSRDPSDKVLSIDLPIPQLITHKLTEGDAFEIAELNLHFSVIEVPGHTLDHIAFVGEGWVFCGDILFAAGCGRIFSGTPQLFAESLDKLMALPKTTEVYCAHEYTVDNLGFSKWVEPKNEAIIQRDKIEIAKQEKGISTVPSTVALELNTNPFVRLQQTEVKRAAEKFAGQSLEENWQIFAALREWKDSQYD